jgi:hypothetical protein
MISSSDDRQLNNYLLGLLTDDETERLDELSIADDEFAARLADAENDLVDAYVRDELRGQRLEQFKSRYLSSPARCEKVKFAMALRDWSEPAAVAAPINAKPERKNWLSNLFAVPALQWGFAAVLILVLAVAGWLGIENTRLRRGLRNSQVKQNELAQREQELLAQLESQQRAAKQAEGDAAQPSDQQPSPPQQNSSERSVVAMLFLTPQLRGAAQPPSVRVDPHTKSVAANLTLEPNDLTAYRVALINQSSQQPLWISGTLKAHTQGNKQMLSLTIRAELLKPQNYSLRVSGLNDKGARELISDYPFKVVK